jgi:hypothetical protein
VTSIEITVSADKQSRERGLHDVTFRRNPQHAFVQTLTADELVDLYTEADNYLADLRRDGYEEPDDFCMFTTAGNRAVAEMIDVLQKELEKGIMDVDQARAFLDTSMDRIAATHGEIWDTDVRENIADEITDAWQEAFGEGITL